MAQPLIADLKTIDEVNTMACSAEFWPHAYTVIGIIDGVDCSGGWQYATCSQCSKGLTVEGGGFWCSICHGVVQFPMIRFRVQLRVLDESGHAAFAIFNQQLERLLYTSANKIVNRLGIGRNATPPDFGCLVGKICNFTIKLPDYLNPDFDYHHIRVVRVSEVGPAPRLVAPVSEPKRKRRQRNIPVVPVDQQYVGPSAKSESCGTAESGCAGVA